MSEVPTKYDFQSLEPASRALPSPIPTQVMSNGEFFALRQSALRPALMFHKEREPVIIELTWDQRDKSDDTIRNKATFETEPGKIAKAKPNRRLNRVGPRIS
jgi:hypothetical protein